MRVVDPFRYRYGVEKEMCNDVGVSAAEFREQDCCRCGREGFSYSIAAHPTLANG